jgi:chromosome condensin MukBEF complex kleisin-like MukF subunit
MKIHSVESESAAAAIERRWFASMSAIRALQAECETLRELMDTVDAAWRRARAQLTRLEAVRDALGDELATRDAREDSLREAPSRAIHNAA